MAVADQGACWDKLDDRNLSGVSTFPEDSANGRDGPGGRNCGVGCRSKRQRERTDTACSAPFLKRKNSASRVTLDAELDFMMSHPVDRRDPREEKSIHRDLLNHPVCEVRLSVLGVGQKADEGVIAWSKIRGEVL
jgi:hypothetical protein